MRKNRMNQVAAWMAVILLAGLLYGAVPAKAAETSDPAVQRIFTEVLKNGSSYYLRGNGSQDDLYRETADGKEMLIARDVIDFRVGQKYIYYLTLRDDRPSLCRVRVDGKGDRLLKKDMIRIYAISGGFVYGKAFSDEGGGGALVRVNSRSGETEILVEEERFAYTWSPEHRNGRFYFEAENDYWSVCYDGTGLREEEAFQSKAQKLRKSIEEVIPESVPAAEDDRLIDAGDGWYAVLKEPAFYLFRADGSEPEKFEISADDVLVRDEHIYIMQDDYQAERRVYRMVR